MVPVDFCFFSLSFGLEQGGQVDSVRADLIRDGLHGAGRVLDLMQPFRRQVAKNRTGELAP